MNTADLQFNIIYTPNTVDYLASLTENLYLATYREMKDFASEVGALQYEQETPAGPNLYVLDVQKYVVFSVTDHT